MKTRISDIIKGITIFATLAVLALSTGCSPGYGCYYGDIRMEEAPSADEPVGTLSPATTEGPERAIWTAAE